MLRMLTTAGLLTTLLVQQLAPSSGQVARAGAAGTAAPLSSVDQPTGQVARSALGERAAAPAGQGAPTFTPTAEVVPVTTGIAVARTQSGAVITPAATATVPPAQPATSSPARGVVPLTSGTSPVTVGTINASYFPNPNNSGPFDVTKGTTPAFTAQVPTLNFDPPAGANVQTICS